MRGPPDIRIRISTENLQSFINPIFQSIRTAIAQNMQDSLPDSGVLIIGHFEHSLPEYIDVSEYFAWAELFGSLESDISVFVVGVFEHEVDVLGGSD